MLFTLSKANFMFWVALIVASNALNLDNVEPHSSVGSIVDLRTGGRWFDPWLGQYSFQGLMMVIATGFIPLSLLSVVSTMVLWESSQWLGKNIVRSTGKKNSRKAWIGALQLQYN